MTTKLAHYCGPVAFAAKLGSIKALACMKAYTLEAEHVSNTPD